MTKEPQSDRGSHTWNRVVGNFREHEGTDEPWYHTMTGTMLHRPYIMQIKSLISRNSALVRPAVGWSVAGDCFPILEVFKDQLDVERCIYKDAP